jgi:hypothetical protein
MFINTDLLIVSKAKGGIEVSAALKLLSSGRAFTSPLVRSYAVEVMLVITDKAALHFDCRC